MIREYVERLGLLSESDWCCYAFAREPLSGRLKADEKLEHYRKAVECGRALAASLKEKHGEKTASQYLKMEGVSVHLDDLELDSSFMTFARIDFPSDVTLYVKNAEATDRLIRENDLVSMVGSVPTSEVLLAHELCHFYENRMPDLYIHQKHVLLFKLGRWENRSRILCLSEIAAMAYARELTGLLCSPYIYDVMMTYACNPQRAKQLYDGIIRVVSG